VEPGVRAIDNVDITAVVGGDVVGLDHRLQTFGLPWYGPHR
jgi:hypothetical protein